MERKSSWVKVANCRSDWRNLQLLYLTCFLYIAYIAQPQPLTCQFLFETVRATNQQLELSRIAGVRGCASPVSEIFSAPLRQFVLVEGLDFHPDSFGAWKRAQLWPREEPGWEHSRIAFELWEMRVPFFMSTFQQRTGYTGSTEGTLRIIGLISFSKMLYDVIWRCSHSHRTFYSNWKYQPHLLV
jgi:hypothetical protein